VYYKAAGDRLHLAREEAVNERSHPRKEAYPFILFFRPDLYTKHIAKF